MELKDNLKSQLNAIRKAKGTSLEALSEKTGIAKSTLQDVEKGKGSTKLDTVEGIARGLEVDPLVLLRKEDATREIRLAESMLATIRGFDTIPEKRRRRVVADFAQTLIDLYLVEDDEAGDEP